MNLYVSNISFHTTESDLKDLFSRFGEVSSATVVTDQDSGRKLGFGFIKMSDEKAAMEAMQALQGKEIEGRPLSVSVARGRTDKQHQAHKQNQQDPPGYVQALVIRSYLRSGNPRFLITRTCERIACPMDG